MKKKNVKQPKRTGRNDYEKRVYQQLKRAKVRFTYEEKRIPYILACSYWTDWVITFPGGHERIIETKGYLRKGDKRKILAVLRQYPGIDFRMLFHERCKEKDLTWCKNNGIVYAIGLVPKEWLSL